VNFVQKIKNYLKENKRRQNEIYWGLVFQSAIANSNWFTNKSINPGRWAAGFPLLYVLFRIYNDMKPTSILECGLGESTKLLTQYQKNNPDVQYTVIEQDSVWLEYFCKNIYDISRHAIVLEIENRKIQDKEALSYKNIISQLHDYKYDCVIIDGPWGSDHYSRYQIVDIVNHDLLQEDFIIILDDYERQGEKQTADTLRRLLQKKNVSFVEGVYSGDKDTLILCTMKYKFLTSI
jgi:ribosomal protein RSM22 (predicted rRNA methylase)